MTASGMCQQQRLMLCQGHVDHPDSLWLTKCVAAGDCVSAPDPPATAQSVLLVTAFN